MVEMWRAAAGLLLLMWGALYLVGLGAPDMDYSIEALRAVVAQNMLETHNWIVPHFRDELYLAKPPLMNWAILFFSLPAGHVSEWSARLPSALSVLGISAFIWAWAWRRGWGRAGLYSAVLFLLLPLVFEKGTRAEIEMNLTLWVAGSLLCLYEGMEAGPGGRFRFGWTIAAYAFLTLALLSKGPPALLFFLGTWLTFQTLRGWRSSGLGNHAAGWGVVVLGLGLWLLPVVRSVGWDTFWGTLRSEAFVRVVEATEVNSAPFYFYPFSVLGGAFPAALFLPWLRWPKEEAGRRRALQFLLCWVGSALILFSLVAGKESRYLLPVYPAMALLGGVSLERFLEHAAPREPRRAARVVLLVLAALILVAGPALWVGQVKLNPDRTSAGLLWAALFSLTGGTALHFTRRSQPRRALLMLLATFVVAKGFFLTAYVPDRNARKSPRALCREVEEHVPLSEVIYLLDVNRPYFDFYLDRNVQTSGSLEEFLEQGKAPGTYYLWASERAATPEHLSQLRQHYMIRDSAPLHWSRRSFVLITLEKE